MKPFSAVLQEERFSFDSLQLFIKYEMWHLKIGVFLSSNRPLENIFLVLFLATKSNTTWTNTMWQLKVFSLDATAHRCLNGCQRNRYQYFASQIFINLWHLFLKIKSLFVGLSLWYASTMHGYHPPICFAFSQFQFVEKTVVWKTRAQGQSDRIIYSSNF